MLRTMARCGLLPDYQDSVKNVKDKEYWEKLALIDGDDPYTIPQRGQWMDDVDC